jgi:hypothetical protein
MAAVHTVAPATGPNRRRRRGKMYMAQNKIECLGLQNLVISLPFSERMAIFEVA